MLAAAVLPLTIATRTLSSSASMHATAMLYNLQVVGWVIGRSGSHIKEMKHRTGCGMWVDQKDLKLYITGSDMPRIHHAAAMVGDLISKVHCVHYSAM
jgi:polyribonucleotide nucleotidyltransferase